MPDSGKDRADYNPRPMRVFLTGATGYIGGAVAEALTKRGHEVAALVRPDSEARHLRDRGVLIVSGDFGTLRDLRPTLWQYDAVVHTAFNMKDPVNSDNTAIEVFTSLDAFFVYTSGVWVLGAGKSDEDSKPNSLALVAWRTGHEQRALATRRAAVIRPGCVYGGKQSLLAQWFAAAEQNQPIQIVGDGNNRWALVDIHDLADCYVRAAEQRASGIFHAVDDSHDSLNDCARAVAPKGKIEHVPAGAAREKMGPFVDALVVDQVVSSDKTRKALGWMPKRAFISSVDEQWREWRSAQKSE